MPAEPAPATAATAAAGGAVTLRRGSATLIGTAVATASGFVLSVLVGRGLGTSGAGVFFAVTALVVILSTVLKLGLDTAQMWRIPRLLGDGHRERVRPTVAAALVPTSAVSVVVAAALAAAAGPVAAVLGLADAPGSAAQVRWSALALALLAPMYVVVAATRGLGAVRPFVAVQNLGLPLGRLAAVGVVLALGGGGVAVMAAWSVPVVLALLAAAWLLRGELVTFVSAGRPRPSRRDVAAPLWAFARPRMVTASIEAVLISVNTLVVGVLIGPAAAGIFGALSRFVTAGTLAEQAIRVLVAPRFSALLGAGDVTRASRLYATTTPWVVAASWPIFLVLATGAPAVLGVFGPGFVDGATALTILALAMCVAQLAGNVQTVLLMGGRSGLQLCNKLGALIVLLVLDAVLIPAHGLVGAAIAWACAILVDALAATLEVRLVLGMRVGTGGWSARVAGLAVLCFVPPTLWLVWPDGGLGALVVAVALGGCVYAPFMWRWHAPLGLTSATDEHDRG